MNVLAEDFNVSEALVKDPSGNNLRAMKDQLEVIRSRIKRQMDKGLTQDEFTVANNLHNACQVAQDVVEQFWSQPRK